MSTYKPQADAVLEFLGTLSDEHAGIAEGFKKLHSSSTTDGALSSKHKELMALGIGISVRCEGCIAFHTAAALKAGATKEEIVETVGVAVLMGGGPAVVYGKKAYEAMEELS